MDRRTLIAVGLCVAIFYAYLLYTQYTAPPVEPPPATSTTAEAPVTPSEPSITPSVPSTPPPVSVATLDLPYDACGAQGTWSNDGSGLRGVGLGEYSDPYEVTTVWGWVLGWFTGGSTWPYRPWGETPGPATVLGPSAATMVVGSGALDAAAPRLEFTSQDPGGRVLEGTTADGLHVKQTVRTTTNSSGVCQVEVEVQWHNPSDTKYGGNLWLAGHDLHSDNTTHYGHNYRPIAMVDGTVHDWTNTTGGGCSVTAALDEPYRYEGPVQWFGLSNGYFSAVVLPPEDAKGVLFHSPRKLVDRTDGKDVIGYGGHYVIESGLAAHETITETYRLYNGPNSVDQLKAYDGDLAYLVDYGWLALFYTPLHWLLRLYHSWMSPWIGEAAWGVSIIGLTFTVKTLFFPLTQQAFRSSQKMQALQPALQKVREEFKDNQEEVQRRTMEMFKKNGVNPVGGCLPMVVQMPIWIALYQMLQSSVEMYHTKFLYLADLSSVDPFGVLPALAMGLMLLQQQIMPTAPGMDPAQARMMKWMPVIFGLFFFTFPSGLVLYIFVNMCLTILQQWVIKKRFGTVAPMAAVI